MPAPQPPVARVPPIAECLGVARNDTKATVYLIHRDTGPVVRKHLAPVARGFLAFLGRYLLARETDLLRRMGETGCVPRVLASGRGWLEMEYVAGETIAARTTRGVTPAEAERVRETLARLHAAGFAHGDVGRRDVVLRDDGGVTFFDVATAIGPGSPPLLWRLLLPLARKNDRVRLRHVLDRACRRAQDRVERRRRKAARRNRVKPPR